MSTPPPAPSQPTPSPQPTRPNLIDALWARRWTTVVPLILLAAFVIAVVAENRKTDESCLITGTGGKLCGDDALTFCDLRAETHTLMAGGREACVSIGWTQP